MHRQSPSVLSLAAVLTLGLGAADAFASSVLSYVSGTIWGSSAGDQDSGSGALPVASSGAYTRPPQVNDGAISGSAFAAVGRLGAHADLTVTNAPGYLSAQYSFYGTSEMQGYGVFQDRWTFSDRPLDTPGALRVTVAFDGAASGSATGATASTFGQLNLDLTSLGEFGNVHESQFYHSGPLAVADEEVVLELAFLYGRPIVVNGSLLAKVQLSSLLDVYWYSGSGDATFDQTAEIVGLEVRDAADQWSTSYTLQTESGGQYPFQVPESSQIGAAAAALAALAGVRRAAGCHSSPSRTR